MRHSQLKIKTLKQISVSDTSPGTNLLLRARYIEKIGSGIYDYLPFGLRSLRKITQIIREEINKIGGIEILLPALHPKKYWQQTNRWSRFDALFKLKSRFGQEFALGPTHEEIITPLAKKFITSYKDLPLFLYQIQTKFRDEPRPKSGLLRAKEFLMKDLYSFHATENDLEKYYEKVKKAYYKIFQRLKLKVIFTEASGGTFSKFSHEFQFPNSAGEDIVYYCPHCHFARNKEIARNLKKCPRCSSPLEKIKTIEVANIFKLKDKYSRPFDLKYKDKNGKEHYVLMGCYGIGISRILGVLAEAYHDKHGLMFPEAVAPFQLYLVTLYTGNPRQDEKIEKYAEKLYQKLLNLNKEVFFDDRKDVSNGVKLKDADLIGFPWRVVVSIKTLSQKKIEIKKRSNKASKLLKYSDFVKVINTK